MTEFCFFLEIIFIHINTVIRVQIPEEAVYISDNANIIRKGIHLIIFPLAMSK